MASDVTSYPQDDTAGGAGSPTDSSSDTSSAPDASASSDNGAGSASPDSSNGAGQSASADTGSSDGSASDASSTGQDSSAAADSSPGASSADASSNGAGQDSTSGDSTSGASTTDSSGGGGQDSSSGVSTSDASSADSSGNGAGQDSSSGDSTSGGSGSSSADGSQDSSAASGSGANGTSAGQSASAGASGAKTDPATGGASGDQTPAKDLTVDPIQPASTTAIAKAAGASSAASDGSGAVPTAEGGVSVSDIIAIGTTAAKIMEASSPDYTMQGKPASVLPRGADPLSLSGVVADPHELKITLHIRNRIHMLIIHLPIVVQWRFGGSYKGTGRYITSASAFLDSGADVGTFYKADVDASLTGPWNAGSDTDPVAAISVMIEVKVVDKTSPYGQNIVLEGSIRGDGAGTLKQRPDA